MYEYPSSQNRTLWTDISGQNVRMDEPKDRLRAVMLTAGCKTAAEAARRYTDINQNTLTSHLNGNRDLSRKAAQDYARIFETTAGWLLYGDEAETDRSDVDVPLLSLISAGHLRAGPTIMPEDVEKWIRVADLPRGDWVAFRVEGDSMNLVAPEGSVILVDRSDRKLINDRYYVFLLDAGEATFKQYRRGPKEHLRPVTTNFDHSSIPVDGHELYVFGRARRVIHDL
jgi:SOS-response transcriptional repressor LexA